jgi:hypothetical protein
MSKSNITLVPASRVRAAFAAGEFTAPEAALPSLVGKNGDGRVRGRLNPLAVAAFNEQVKGEQYAGEKSPVESKSITLPLTKTTAAGAKVKRPEAFPLSEVRALAGVVGKKGRLSASEVETATQAVIAQRGWDTKPAKVAKGSQVKTPA